jgi:SAM-dependent methyltransferase
MSKLRRVLTTNASKRPARAPDPDEQWFFDHYRDAPGQIVSFCRDGGLELAGRAIADVGCGDGVMDLGLFHQTNPRRLVGFDVVPTDRASLLQRARRYGVAQELPTELEFRSSSATVTPAEDDEFDFVYSWSAFEHIPDPVPVLREIHRILRPDGHFFLQLWPFYFSPKGSHLWDWFPEDHHHLRTHERDVVSALQGSDRHSPDWTQYMSSEFERLNRITLDELQRSVLAAGFDVHRLELLTTPVHLTPDLGRYPWTDLAIGGIKLIALPAR